jgi:hypothetical protein
VERRRRGAFYRVGEVVEGRGDGRRRWSFNALAVAGDGASGTGFWSEGRGGGEATVSGRRKDGAARRRVGRRTAARGTAGRAAALGHRVSGVGEEPPSGPLGPEAGPGFGGWEGKRKGPKTK